jgi:hypothetical protein
MKNSLNFGIILLAVWLVLFGLSNFINIGDLRKALDVLAIVAGVLLLIGK